MKHYLFVTEDDVEPEIQGPFGSAEERDAAARAFRNEHGSDHGLFPLDILDDGMPETWAYSSAYLEEDETDPA